MIKVLHIGFSDNYGGIEACIMNYYRNIDRNRFQFDFIDMRDRDIAYREEIIAMGGKVHKIKFWSKNPVKAVITLKKIINDNGYDVVHFNMYSIANLLQFLAADASRAKAWLVHAHTTRGEIGKIKLFLQNINSRILAGKANCLCACSEKASRWMYRNIPKDYQVKIINNAVDLKKLRFDPEVRKKIRTEQKLENCFVIGHIGRFTPPKNHTRLIDIFHWVYQKDSGARLVLVGDGELRAAIEEKVEGLGLKEAVTFTGMITDAYPYYNAFDIFVLPSLFEGLPVVGIEAQASGLPIVVADCVTQEMKLTEDVNYLSLSDSDETWAETILQYRNQNKRKNTVSILEKANMDITKEAEKLMELYQILLK